MTENTHHDPAALDKLAEPFTVLPNDNPASDEKRQSLIDKPAFGQVFSDNMTHMTWTKGEGWSDRRVEPYAPLKMDPGASVLHYAQECFEGLKAYRHADGSTWLFRPDANAERFQNSAKRLYLPELPIDDFLGSVAALVKRDANWVPSRREYTLYMRPFMFASEPFLGVRAPQEVDYCVIASPSGPYFPGGVKPVSIWVEDKWFRTGPGGTGFAKCGGNYAASLLGEYKGVEVKREHTLVTEDEVNAEIEKERNKQAAEVAVDDRPVAEGDTVNLDYSGSVDGVKFAGGTAENQTLKIGSHTFIPGFEEQMVGMNIGEEKDLNVTFPTEYHAEELAGKEAVFHVKVNGITETQLPALDDDFAKDISEFDTLDAYKADVRAKLEAQAAERDNNVFTNAVIGKVMENATVEIPAAMIERQIDSMIRNFEARLAQQGLKLADFMKYTGQDEKSFRGQYRDQAEKSVRANLVLEAIENAENFEVSDEEIDAEIEKFAKQIGQSVEELKKNLTEGDREYFKADVIRDKAVKFLCDNAKAE